MSDILVTASGVVGTEPRHNVVENTTPVTSFRLASSRRRLVNEQWVDGPTTWLTVTCWRQLALNAHRSLEKGQRVVVQGRLLVRRWQTADGRSGLNVEIEAHSLGQDLLFGTTRFERTPRNNAFAPVTEPEAAAHLAQVTADGEEVENWTAKAGGSGGSGEYSVEGSANDDPGIEELDLAYVDQDGVVIGELPDEPAVPRQFSGAADSATSEQVPAQAQAQVPTQVPAQVPTQVPAQASADDSERRPEPVLAGGRSRRR